MSFLLPTLRNAFRSNIRTTTNILRQQYYVSRQIHPHLLIPSTTRFYSKGNPGPNNSNSDSKKESIENAAVTDSTAPKDHLSGDVQATPGSILSEYTAPQGSAQLEPSASDSGSGQLPKKEEYVSSTDRKRQRIAKTLSWGSLLGLLGGSIWLGRPLDEEEEERMGWENVSPTKLMWLRLVTSRTYADCILETIPETRKIHACCTHIILEYLLMIVFQRTGFREVTSSSCS
jgi:hypothetical protein